MSSKYLAVVLAVAACTARQPADLVLENTKVYTGNEQQPTAEAVAVKDGRIIFVGTNAEARRYQGSQTKVIDLARAVVYPGFADAHYHLTEVGEREMVLNLEGTTTKEAFLAKVKERVASAKPGEWVVGRGWIETFWTPPVFPTRQDLDAIAPANPVVLGRADGHAAIANTAALKAAGVTRATVPPPGGALNKDARGELTGMLIDAAQDLVYRTVPPATEAARDSAVIIGARRSVTVGWTQVQDAGGSWDDVARFRRLYQGKALSLRIYKAIWGPSVGADSLIAAGPTLGEFGGRLTVRTIKVVFDGALGSRGAALLAPYSDDPKNRGLITTDTAALRVMLPKALERGIQVETHAIGDRANRLVLDAYQRAFEAVPVAQRKIAEPRFRIEHAQIVDPADIPRFKALDVIPSMQPSHAIGDLYFAPSRLGTSRLAGAYAWHSFLESGVPVPGGSDAPVERGEPMVEFYAAVARKDLKGNMGSAADWHPEQRVSREEALKMFTRYPAYAAFEENVRGSIEVGKYADFTVLSQDIMTIPESEIPKTAVVMTVIGGEVAYRKAP